MVQAHGVKGLADALSSKSCGTFKRFKPKVIYQSNKIWSRALGLMTAVACIVLSCLSAHCWVATVGASVWVLQRPQPQPGCGCVCLLTSDGMVFGRFDFVSPAPPSTHVPRPAPTSAPPPCDAML